MKVAQHFVNFSAAPFTRRNADEKLSTGRSPKQTRPLKTVYPAPQHELPPTEPSNLSKYTMFHHLRELQPKIDQRWHSPTLPLELDEMIVSCCHTVGLNILNKIKPKQILYSLDQMLALYRVNIQLQLMAIKGTD